jgi:3-(3-hydroxy-phenyl)propionate hydroxylase
MCFGDAPSAAVQDGLRSLQSQGVALRTLCLPTTGLVAERFDALPGTAYLLRPDQHVAARWRQPQPAKVAAAMARACAKEGAV